MSDKAFIDTNIVIYAFSRNDRRAVIANRLLDRGCHISVQVLNEFCVVARNKLAMSWDEISVALAAIRTLSPHIEPVTLDLHDTALALARRYGYRMYDCLIIAAAIRTGCPTLYSEDLQAGQIIEGTRIENPFLS